MNLDRYCAHLTAAMLARCGDGATIYVWDDADPEGVLAAVREALRAERRYDG